MKWDLHIHTSRHSPDSIIDPRDLVRRAIDVGLEGIVITEHDWLWTEDELEELRALAPELVILAGVEVTSRGGDILCYGVKDPFSLKKGTPFAEICAEVRRQGGACIAAHPYRWNQPFDDILSRHRPALDGIEVMSNNMDAELRQLAGSLLAREPQFAGLGNSDAHQTETLGCCMTEFQIPVKTSEDLVKPIQNRACRAVNCRSF